MHFNLAKVSPDDDELLERDVASFTNFNELNDSKIRSMMGNIKMESITSAHITTSLDRDDSFREWLDNETMGISKELATIEKDEKIARKAAKLNKKKAVQQVEKTQSSNLKEKATTKTNEGESINNLQDHEKISSNGETVGFIDSTQSTDINYEENESENVPEIMTPPTTELPPVLEVEARSLERNHEVSNPGFPTISQQCVNLNNDHQQKNTIEQEQCGESFSDTGANEGSIGVEKT